MLLRKEPETIWRTWGVSGDMNLLRGSHRDGTSRWVHQSSLIRQTACRWAELQGKPARDIEQIRTSKREETAHKGGRYLAWAKQSTDPPAKCCDKSASFVFASLRVRTEGEKISHPERKTRISLIGYQSITLYTGAMLPALLWQKLKVSIVFDIHWLSGILLVQQRCCTRKILYGDHQWTLLEVTAAWCLQDHTK